MHEWILGLVFKYFGHWSIHRLLFLPHNFQIFLSGFRRYIFIAAFWFCLQTARSTDGNVSVTEASVLPASIHFSHP